MITIFKNFGDPNNPYHISLDSGIARIRNGKSKAIVDQIQASTDSKQIRDLKLTLPCILFSGVFSYRNDESLSNHSGLLIVDYDSKPDKGFFIEDKAGFEAFHRGIRLVVPESPSGKPVKASTYALIIDDAAALRDSLKQYPFVICAFISPSGKGVKALVRIPPVISQHRGHYQALLKTLKVLDSTSINESRICYESYDPDVWYEPQRSAVFEDYSVPEEKKAPEPMIGVGRTDYSKLNICAAMIRNSVDGEKHDVLNKASHLAGGYIAGGVFGEEIAIKILEEEIAKKANVDDFPSAQRTIREGIQSGKLEPIYGQIPEQKPVEKGETTNDVRYLDQAWDRMKYQFKHGKPRGSTTYFPEIDKYFTWKLSDLNGWSGIPNSGKSELFSQLAVAKSFCEGWTWAVFSPESYPEDEFYDGLIHTLVGKSVDPSYANQMSESEYEQAAQFVKNHFFYIYPDSAHTIEQIEKNFEYCIKKHKCKGVLVDPFNQLSRGMGGVRDDQYLENFLTVRKRFAITHNISYNIISHPKMLPKNKDGEFDAVHYYDLAGGAMWGNKLDNFMSIRRPEQVKNPSDNGVEFHSIKIKKQKLVGITGTAFITFDRQKNRYYSEAGFNPLPPVVWNKDSTPEIESHPRQAGTVDYDELKLKVEADPEPHSPFPANASSFFVRPIEPEETDDDPIPF